MKRHLALASMITLLAAGCGSAAGTGASGSGGSGSHPDAPISHDRPPGSQPGAPGRATLVTPRAGGDAGTLVLPVKLRAGVGNDGRAWAWVSWWGGIPSCYVLRPVRVHTTGTTIRLGLWEGSDATAGTVCADIAMLKAVRVDLGALGPGSYTVIAGAKRAALTVT